MDEDDFLESEAEESEEDGGGDDASESEEGEQQAEGLINDQSEESVKSSDGESDVEERRKRKRHEYQDLLPEDYDLLEENLGMKMDRKKFRRVHMESDDEEMEVRSVDTLQGSTTNSVRRGKRLDIYKQPIEQQINDEDLYSDSDQEADTQSRASANQDQGTAAELFGGAMSESEEEDDFIVDELGRPINRKKGGDQNTDIALLEAQKVFGLDFDMEEFAAFGDDKTSYLDEEEEDEELGGDADLEYRSKKPKRKKQKGSMFDVYEPSELEQGHFTDKDQEIRITDLPEQFLQRSYPVEERDVSELEKEARWIYQQAFVTRAISKQPNYSNSDRYRPDSTINKIKDTLDFICNQKFVIPYIANYKKEYVEPELDMYDLWRVWQWDEKWCQLCTRKKSLKKLFVKVQELQFEQLRNQPDEAIKEGIRPLEEKDLERLDFVQTIEELNDVYSHFLLYYGNDLVTMRNKHTGGGLDGDIARQKHAQRRDFYTICKESNLGGLVAKFGLKPEQFGDNLRDGYQKHETEQHPVEPEECAAEFVKSTGHFCTVDAVLHGSRHMVAMELASDPTVRQVIRRAFRERAILSVRPTKKGKKEIDENSVCFGFKYLKNKPVRDLKGDQFLRIVQAEQDGLLVSAIRIDLDTSSDGRSFGTYFDEIKQYFYRDEFSLLVEKWNVQRAQALAHALLRVLYPLMERELRTKLLQEAKEFVTQYCVDKMHHWLNVAPYRPERELEEGDYSRIMGCSFTDDKNMPVFFVALDGCGEVVDFLKLNHFLKRKNSYWESEKEDKVADIEKLNSFMLKHHPDVVAVPASCRDGLMVVTDIKQCLSDLEGENEDMAGVLVELVDPSMAAIYAKSKRGKEEFPEYPELLLEAISISRRLQDPLMEFCALFASPEEEIYSLKIHILQSAVPKENLCVALQAEFITRVNEVGVDLNLAIDHPHLLPCVQFLAGLGPRKAAGLIKILKQETSRLESRSQLVTVCSLGPKVFMNCAGFIKIINATLNDSDNSGRDLLDCTRIHPETYEWARKMAVDALEYDEIGDDTNPNNVIEEIMESPEKLRDLDLDAFAEELERQGLGKKRATLYDIRDELFDPYKDKRPSFASMELEEQFSLLTGETPESLYEGKLITCSVVAIVRRKPSRELLDRAQPIQNEMTGFWQCPFCLQDDFHDIGLVWNHIDEGSCPGQGIGVRARLENGLSGFILTKNLSDKPVTTPEERVNIGRTIHCRILRVNLEKFSVDLTCRSSDLADRDNRFSLPKDTYFDHQQEEHDSKTDHNSKQKPKQQYMKRVIVHPSFMNISFKEAEETLSSMDQGEAIFRPSSKGTDHLTVTWKVDTGIHQHIDITEKDKPNVFSLGKTLLIGEEEFEDLDEILARFIHPMALLSRELHAHKSYRSAEGGNVNKLITLLAEEKKQHPTRIPYFFSASKQLPGKYVLAYQPANKPKIEYFTVTSEGYRYRGLVHSDIHSLLKYFKEHYREAPPRPMVPGSAQPTPSASMIMTPGSMVGLSQPYTPSQSVHQWSTTPQYGYQQQMYRGSAQSSWQTPAYTPTQPVGTPTQTPNRTPHYMTTPQGPTQGSFSRGRGGGGGGHHKGGGRGGSAPWKQSSGNNRRSHNRQRQ